VEVSNTTDLVSILGLSGSPVCPQKASPARKTLLAGTKSAWPGWSFV
jgi:hypothetical protein